MKPQLAMLFGVLFLAFTVPNAFADVIVSAAPGSSVPGCEATNDCYIPEDVSIGIGESVIWSNDDTAAHTVTSGDNSPDGNFDSSLFMAGTTFEVQFDDAGVYPYFCMVHPWMVGTVNVGDVNILQKIETSESVTSDNSIELQQLRDENIQLRTENQQLRVQLDDLKQQVTDLNALLMEQLRVIYEWVVSK